MKRVRFLMIGGFLGAGKTTAIARLARHYIESGLKVGLVTNDQAFGLVDTQSLRAQGFDVGEVTGACFCCKFNDLIATAQQLTEDNLPDVIIAEPVGSCTDLVATVMEPLQKLYGEQYEIGPLAVLFKPEHGQKILDDEEGLGFSPKAAYIFLKQIEEADVIVLNKIDKLSAVERQRLVDLVRLRFPGKEVLAASAREGDGFDEVIEVLSRPELRRVKTPEVDYDIYAEGEAELGWLNCSVRLSGGPFDLDVIVKELVERLANACSIVDAEPAHLKILGQAGDATAIANLVGSRIGSELSLVSHATVNSAELTVNARVAIAPETLTEIVASEAAALAEDHALKYEISDMQSFRPGRPVPTHRMPLGQS
jgi:Ni2+-binding GTPase involved in maturation of urease and hydrogenase